jgi:competence protein ComFC
LIDDIYTTGATMHAAAYALRRGGACEVVGFTIAR